MECYFPKVSKASRSAPIKKQRSHPHESQEKWSSDTTPQTMTNRRFTVTELNRSLLNSLKSEHNPITHSDAGNRADHVVSVSTGHQVNEERLNRRLYLDDREKKLREQRGSNSSPTGIFRSVRVYLSGYLRGTTDIEMKRIIAEAGGRTVMIPSRCTHIVTSQWLSGSKTHRLLTTKARNNPYIVRPEWILESIDKGCRQSERNYAISMDHSHKSFTT